MIILAWVILIGGFIFGKEVLHLQLGSLSRAIYGLIICSISALFSWLGYKSRTLEKQDTKYAIVVLGISSIGAIYFLYSILSYL